MEPHLFIFNKMETFLELFLIVIVVVSVWILIRNIKVYLFQIYLNQHGYDICNEYLNSVEVFDEKAQNEFKFLKDTWDSITDISYERMLFSFKPLKPEYWLNEKQLKFLTINKFD